MADKDDYQFIEVKRVVSDGKGGKNVSANYETYPIADIHTARPWHKGRNDEYIQGEMTLVALFSRKKDPLHKRMKMEGGAPVTESKMMDPKLRTILIEENYDEFVHRLNKKAPVNMLPRDE